MLPVDRQPRLSCHGRCLPSTCSSAYESPASASSGRQEARPVGPLTALRHQALPQLAGHVPAYGGTPDRGLLVESVVPARQCLPACRAAACSILADGQVVVAEASGLAAIIHGERWRGAASALGGALGLLAYAVLCAVGHRTADALRHTSSFHSFPVLLHCLSLLKHSAPAGARSTRQEAPPVAPERADDVRSSPITSWSTKERLSKLQQAS